MIASPAVVDYVSKFLEDFPPRPELLGESFSSVVTFMPSIFACCAALFLSTVATVLPEPGNVLLCLGP